MPSKFIDLLERKNGGEGGIRTLGRGQPSHAFQACALNRSATSPFSVIFILRSFSKASMLFLTNHLFQTIPHGGVYNAQKLIFPGQVVRKRSLKAILTPGNSWLAERVGFEPTVPQNGTTDFESAAFDLSAISPSSENSMPGSVAGL